MNSASPSSAKQSGGRNGEKPTVAGLAKWKRLPASFLKADAVGLRDLPDGVGIPYYDATGEELFVRVRVRYQDEGDKRRFRQPKGVSPAAYGQWRLEEARLEGHLYIVEGESNCWALWCNGLPALGVPGAELARVLQHEHVEGLGAVYVHKDPDRGGETFIKGVAARLAAVGFQGNAYELRMPEGVKDPSDLHAADPGRFKVRIQECIAASKLLPLQTGPKEALGLQTTALTEIRPEPVRWLVPGYLPLGKLVLIAGDGGHGKSSLTLHLAAALTRSLPAFGLQYDPPAPAEVLLISCEDDFADTVVPRLLTAGADMAKVFRVDGVRTKDDKPAPFSLTHYRQLEAELEARPNVRLVVIDPAGAYVGNAGIDDHKDSELRSLLGPLAELAARRRVAILAVKHVTKGTTGKAVHRVTGGAGYVNTVRAAFVVCPDKDDDKRKLFLPLKFNLGPKPAGLSYRIEGLPEEEQADVLAPFTELEPEDRLRLGGQLIRLRWEGVADIDADSAMGDAARRERDPNKVEKAVAWLSDFLQNFAYPGEEILAAAADAGFTFDNIKEAKVRLKMKGLRNVKRGGGGWWTGFGDPIRWRDRPAPDAPPTGEPEKSAPQFPHFDQSGSEIDGKRLYSRSGETGETGERSPEYDDAHNPHRNGDA